MYESIRCFFNQWNHLQLIIIFPYFFSFLPSPSYTILHHLALVFAPFISSQAFCLPTLLIWENDKSVLCTIFDIVLSLLFTLKNVRGDSTLIFFFNMVYAGSSSPIRLSISTAPLVACFPVVSACPSSQGQVIPGIQSSQRHGVNPHSSLYQN